MAITKEYIVLNEVEVDFIAAAPSPVVICPQFEDRGRAIKVSLKNNREDFPVPEGYTPHVYELKYDKKVVDNICEYDGNTVIVEVTKQMSFTPGDNLLRVALISDETGAVAQSVYIVLKVTKGPNIDDAESSGDELNAIRDYAARAQNAAKSAEQSKIAAKTSETNAKSSELNAAASESAAANSASAAKISETNAAGSASNAYAKADDAAENAQAAAASAAAAQQAAQEALGFRTFFSAVTPDTNGNLDPSRPMTVGPAAGVEIESAGDRIQSVTAHGFTTQAGTGDPSINNIRALTNGGLKLVAVTFDGSSDEDWKFDAASTGAKRYYIFTKNAAQADAATGFAVASRLKLAAAGATTNPALFNIFTIASDNAIYVRTNNESLADFKSRLAADPLTVWYATTDGTGSLYAPIIIQSGEYRATCLPLTAPLCDGDSVVSWVKSGCDKVLVLDGSSDEDWRVFENGFAIYTVFGDSVPMDSRVLNKNIFCNRLFQHSRGSSATVQNPIGSFSPSSGNQYGGNWLIANTGITDLETFKSDLAAHPLTVWYRSTNYTDDADIPVSLETHQRVVQVLDGTKGWQRYYTDPSVTNHKAYLLPVAGTVTSQNSGKQVLCTIAPTKNASYAYADDANAVFSFPNGNIGLQLPTETAGTVSALKSHLAAQYAAGTPVTIVYQLATPATYAHPAVVLEAATGDRLTYTVTGQAGGQVAVTLKPFQDGGRAKTADSAANAQNTVNAQTANNSQQLGGLTLSALQNRLVPVGYIFSWAPTSGGPDLSTASKVAAYFGFGTWQAYGNGQVLVGFDAGQTEFATVGKTGGEKTHKMTISEMPSHRHEVKWSSEGGTGSGHGCLIRDSLSGESWPYGYWTGQDGGGQAHNNLQPYITVYRWQRVK